MVAATTAIPTQWVGPVTVHGNVVDGEAIRFPLATYETPLWPSVARGARVFEKSGGLHVQCIHSIMTRSVVVSAPTSAALIAVCAWVEEKLDDLKAAVRTTSRYARLKEVRPFITGNLLYLRFGFTTGDASGHNMATLAAERLLQWILTECAALKYGSISANICVDKKNSAINSILGRGKRLVADSVIPARILRRYLRTTAHRMVELHTRKNLIGSLMAGSVASANAHVANMLLAFYLATGQDGANVVEGSQAITHMEARGNDGARGSDDADLYFSLTLPNIIVGTVGNGKQAGDAQRALVELGCARDEQGSDGNAKRLAVIAATACACGELSLLAAQTNPGELVASHLRYERRA